MSKTVPCPDGCGERVRPCNLQRHRRSHVPDSAATGWGTKFLQPRRPLRQARHHDHRYDEHFPRGEGPFRFRIYRLRAGVLELIAAAPTPPCVGTALYELDQDGEFIIDDSTGVLDTVPDPGNWLVHPFALGRRVWDGAKSA